MVRLRKSQVHLHMLRMKKTEGPCGFALEAGQEC